MTEGNGASRPLYTLPDELFKFVVGELPYAIDIIDCHQAQNRIADQVNDHPDDAFWFLTAFADWLALNGGPPTVRSGGEGCFPILRNSQLDALWFKCREEFQERKKSQNASLARVLNSRTSTTSSQEDQDPSPAGS